MGNFRVEILFFRSKNCKNFHEKKIYISIYISQDTSGLFLCDIIIYCNSFQGTWQIMKEGIEKSKLIHSI